MNYLLLISILITLISIYYFSKNHLMAEPQDSADVDGFTLKFNHNPYKGLKSCVLNFDWQSIKLQNLKPKGLDHTEEKLISSIKYSKKFNNSTATWDRQVELFYGQKKESILFNNDQVFSALVPISFDHPSLEEIKIQYNFGNITLLALDNKGNYSDILINIQDYNWTSESRQAAA